MDAAEWIDELEPIVSMPTLGRESSRVYASLLDAVDSESAHSEQDAPCGFVTAMARECKGGWEEKPWAAVDVSPLHFLAAATPVARARCGRQGLVLPVAPLAEDSQTDASQASSRIASPSPVDAVEIPSETSENSRKRAKGGGYDLDAVRYPPLTPPHYMNCVQLLHPIVRRSYPYCLFWYFLEPPT